MGISPARSLMSLSGMHNGICNSCYISTIYSTIKCYAMSIKNKDLIEYASETPGVEEDIVLAAAIPQSAAGTLQPVSGLYMRSSPSVLPSVESNGQDLMPLQVTDFAEAGMREELRLDIDGSLPQHVASGTIY